MDLFDYLAELDAVEADAAALDALAWPVWEEPRQDGPQGPQGVAHVLTIEKNEATRPSDRFRAKCRCSPWKYAARGAHGREEVILAWHDHAWPGWRNLPVHVMRRCATESHWEADVRATQPIEWQVPNAPVVTTRREGFGRSTPQRSPWGGFNIAATWLPAENYARSQRDAAPEEDEEA